MLQKGIEKLLCLLGHHPWYEIEGEYTWDGQEIWSVQVCPSCHKVYDSKSSYFAKKESDARNLPNLIAIAEKHGVRIGGGQCSVS